VNDEFANEPRMARSSTRRASSQNAEDVFDADEAWDTAATRRNDYGARNQQRAQSAGRPSSGRYAGEARPSSGSTRPSSASRYETSSENAYYRESGYQNGSYQSGGYQSERSSYGASGYSGRSASAAASPYYGNEGMSEQNTSAGGYHKHRIATFSIRTVDECKNVIRTLIDKKSVLLSLEEMDSVQAQRAVDTMSGATYAIGAKMNRASERSWLITPSTVEIDEGVQPQENNGFGMQYR